MDHLSDLPWADNDPFSRTPIDIILGADVYCDLLLGGVRKDALGQPIAQNMVLGWVISGPIPSNTIQSHLSVDQSVRVRQSVDCRPSMFQFILS